MSSCREEMASRLTDQAWKRLTELESLHREIQKNHERVIRTLDEATASRDRRDLQIAWNQYRVVVADLGRVTEDIESLRLNSG